MKSNTVINSVLVIVGFLLAFGVGYLILGKDDAGQTDESSEVPETEEQEQEEANDAAELASMIPDEAAELSKQGCLSCHSVESIDAPGGDIGPDLSRAFPEMKAKHGKELDEFLQDPSSAVMATIIAEKPLEDDEREEIVKVLKEASEKRTESSEEADDTNDSEEGDESEEEAS